jgi:cysteine desulfurase
MVGNASSVHSFGRHVRKHIESMRELLADTLQAKSKHTVFTSGATEANNMVLKGFPGPVIVSAIEHDAVRLVRDDAYICPVDNNGLIDLSALSALLKDQTQPCLVSVMYANNETGVIQPLSDVVGLAQKYGAIVHSDCAQAIGKIPFDLNSLGIDYLTLSGSKIGGPQGVGAVVMRRDLPLKSLQIGGGQERSYRPGTENVLGIMGLGAALKACLNDDWQPAAQLRDHLEQHICKLSSEVQIFGAHAPRLPNTSNLTMPGIKSATQVIHFDMAGIAISAGAACSSGKVQTSPILLAMGVPADVANTAIRVSLGTTTTTKDIESFITAWGKLFDQCRQAATQKEPNYAMCA